MYDERVCCFRQNDSYFAHLSIYDFALQWCRGKVVLDAGCGTGYGSAYLTDHGALFVRGVDADPEAIEICRKQFLRDNLRFDVADLRKIADVVDQTFDVVFASNSLEHVENVDTFFLSVCRILSVNGLLVVAVPAPRDASGVAFELSNPHHLNIWSPEHWFHTLKRYFSDVRCFRHELRTGCRMSPDSRSEAKIRKTDFTFVEGPLTGLYSGNTFTAVFVASNPLPGADLPLAGSALPIRDYSVSRRLQAAWMQPFQWAYYKVRYIIRYQGVSALPGRVWMFIRKFRNRR